jgi:hypothetical protein
MPDPFVLPYIEWIPTRASNTSKSDVMVLANIQICSAEVMFIDSLTVSK